MFELTVNLDELESGIFAANGDYHKYVVTVHNAYGERQTRPKHFICFWSALDCAERIVDSIRCQDGIAELRIDGELEETETPVHMYG